MITITLIHCKFVLYSYWQLIIFIYVYNLFLVFFVQFTFLMLAYKTILQVVIFFSTCDAVDFHYTLINEFQWSYILQPEVNQQQKILSCTSFRLHGNMEQDDRRKAFQGFSSEKSALLLCTDVAARGLDFPKVRCIMQYDSPGEASEYVHRYFGFSTPYLLLIRDAMSRHLTSNNLFCYCCFFRVGRTARLGEKGEALLFLQPIEIDYLHDLQRHGVSLTEYPLQKDLDRLLLHSQKNHRKKSIFLETHPWLLLLQNALEIFISKEVSACHSQSSF